MSNKTPIPADSVDMALHTALRKLCDSDPTSYAWNAINLLDGTWTAYCDAVARAGATTGPELELIFHDPDSWWSPEKVGNESQYARTIFRMALEDFDDGDWRGMAGYLTEEDA